MNDSDFIQVCSVISLKKGCETLARCFFCQTHRLCANLLQPVSVKQTATGGLLFFFREVRQGQIARCVVGAVGYAVVSTQAQPFSL